MDQSREISSHRQFWDQLGQLFVVSDPDRQVFEIAPLDLEVEGVNPSGILNNVFLMKES